MQSPTVLEKSRTSDLSEESSGGRPAHLGERGREDSQLSSSKVSVNLEFEAAILGLLVEDPVDEEGSRVNAP